MVKQRRMFSVEQACKIIMEAGVSVMAARYFVASWIFADSYPATPGV
jgi:hypothetical protein